MGKTLSASLSLVVIPFLPQIANDIRSAIDKYKAQYRETEEDAAKDIPFLFREYATASEEDREQILVRSFTVRRRAHFTCHFSMFSNLLKHILFSPQRGVGTSGNVDGCKDF
jgi:hypothetical protein